MATQVLPIADTKVSAEFTLSGPTLVWVHGTGALNAYVGIDAKGSDGVFSQVAELGGSTLSGVLPAGDYRASRISGTCGFQTA